MKTRIIAAAIAAILMFPFLSTAAFAVEIDAPEDVPVTEEPTSPEESPDDEMVITTPVTDYPEIPPRPFSPSGAGTVIDYATDADGKMFYTIKTPDEHVFYLVIDQQRNTDNVYFLNAVTVDDLLALAADPKPKAGAVTPSPLVTAPEPSVPETPPTPEQPQGGGNAGMFIFIGIVVIVGGGAGWYFKIYRPKQQGTASVEEYEPAIADDENEYPDDWGDGSDDNDSPPWDEDDDGE